MQEKNLNLPFFTSNSFGVRSEYVIRFYPATYEEVGNYTSLRVEWPKLDGPMYLTKDMIEDLRDYFTKALDTFKEPDPNIWMGSESYMCICKHAWEDHIQFDTMKCDIIGCSCNKYKE